MSIVAGNDILASDFVSTSSGASDSGKVPKLDSTGKIPTGFMRFGGDGSDGALSISSGTTSIDLGGADIFVKNYSSISITGTGKLAFTNPSSRGTLIVLKSSGNVTLTSSGSPNIELASLGPAVGTADYWQMNGGWMSLTAGTTSNTIPQVSGAGGGNLNMGGGASVAFFGSAGTSFTSYGAAGKCYKMNPITRDVRPGGSGASAGTTGGRGAGGLLIECAGALNFTGTISGVGASVSIGGSNTNGGGGGAGASVMILYNTLTANTGTITVTGGTGGPHNGSTYQDGGNGSDGQSLVAQNVWHT